MGETKPVVIRNCTYADWPAVLLMAKKQLPEYSLRKVLYHLRHNGDTTRVALISGKRAGFFQYHLSPRDDKVAWLNMIAVHGDFQTHGVGERLLAELEKEARAKKLKAIELQVKSHRVRAIALYSRLGYSRLRREGEKQVDDYTFRKPLS